MCGANRQSPQSRNISNNDDGQKLPHCLITILNVLNAFLFLLLRHCRYRYISTNASYVYSEIFPVFEVLRLLISFLRFGYTIMCSGKSLYGKGLEVRRKFFFMQVKL